MSTENVIIKDWRKIDVSFGLVYPNKFSLGMSSYSIRLLYFLINSFDKIACERIFIPDNLYLKFPASKDYSSKNVLRSLENKALPEDFDILGFSLHFENDFKNIFWILDKAEIPLTFQERQQMINKDNTKFPLLIAGGPAITSNPIPLSKFFDILFIGDSEQNLKLFFDVYQVYNNQKINFKEFLEEAKNIEGLFVPALNNKTKRPVLKDLNDSPNPVFQLISNQPNKETIFENYFFVEINRGCPFQCKFCISSFHNYPFRNRSYENIINSIQESIKYSNYEISHVRSIIFGGLVIDSLCYVFSCKSFDTEKAAEFLIKAFEATKVEKNVVKRGLDFPRKEILVEQR